MLVLQRHGTYCFGSLPWEKLSPTFARFVEVVGPEGERGVDLFFVLSGFLVAGLLFAEHARTGTVNVVRFLVRRGLKIYPAFWALLFVTVMLGYVRNGRWHWAEFFAELFFLQNYLVGLWEHTWSLAVEEHFYLILIGVFFLFKRSAKATGGFRLDRFPRVFDAALLACFAGKALAWWYGSGDFDDRRWYFWATHIRIDALFFGALLAYYWHQKWNDQFKAQLLNWRWVWLVVGILLVSPISYDLLGFELWRLVGFNLVYLGAGGLLLAALSLDGLPVARWLKGIAWLGSHSYSVYLWHMLVLSWFTPSLHVQTSSPPRVILANAIYIATAWAFGITMARIIEFPVLRLRERFFPAAMERAKEA